MRERILYRGAPCRLDGRTRVVAGARLYERFAERVHTPVVVMLHGVGVSGRYLLPTAGRLAAHHRVYAPDLPGWGRSGKPPERASVPSLAALLGAWFEAAVIGRADAVVANSFGCQVAIELAATRPDLVARLVLVGPTLDRRARSLGRALVRLAGDTAREPAGLWVIVALDYTVHVAKSGAAVFRAMLSDRPEEKLASISAPTLVVRGKRDTIAPRRWVEEVAAALCGRSVEVPDAPHAVNYAAPDWLAELVTAALSEPPVV